MSLYAISDLHLSFYKSKPMDIFGANWKDHPKKIKNNWISKITDEDTVLIGGDVSWAKNLDEFKPDFDFIKGLEGKKIISRGNHDYWWTSADNMNSFDENTAFVKNGVIIYENICICIIRGWVCPNDSFFTPHDKKIYMREVNRLEAVLSEAKEKNMSEIMVLMHYPPTNDKKENSLFIDLFKKYSVKTVLYGHLHGKNSFNSSYKGEVDGINYYLTSADYLNFIPKKII